MLRRYSVIQLCFPNGCILFIPRLLRLPPLDIEVHLAEPLYVVVEHARSARHQKKNTTTYAIHNLKL